MVEKLFAQRKEIISEYVNMIRGDSDMAEYIYSEEHDPYNHIIYRFPNGYGVSLVWGSVSCGTYEVSIIARNPSGNWTIIRHPLLNAEIMRYDNKSDALNLIRKVKGLS